MNFIYWLLIGFIILFNLSSNIIALKYYTNSYYFEELYSKHWVLRIPLLTWYWLEALIRFKLLKDVLFTLTCVSIGIVFIFLAHLVNNITFLFNTLCIIILTAASLFLGYLIFAGIETLVAKLKKKKTKQMK